MRFALVALAAFACVTAVAVAQDPYPVSPYGPPPTCPTTQGCKAGKLSRSVEAEGIFGIGKIINHPSGLIRMGILPGGNLNTAVANAALQQTHLSAQSVRVYGLRYVDNDVATGTFVDAAAKGLEYELTAPGCLCEGWGAGYWAADGTTFLAQGSADESGGYVGVTGGTVVADAEDFTAHTATAEAQVSCITVRHIYSPSTSPYLFKVRVEIVNNCPHAIGKLKYIRKMDWDMEPSAFAETVEIHPGAAGSDLECAFNDGFIQASVEPPKMASELISGGPYPCQTGPVNYTQRDQGAYFRFNFHDVTAATPLPTGATKSFTTYYGAAPSRALALSALAGVGAEIYSLGHPTSPGTATGFSGIFGFGDVGGTPILPTPSTHYVPCDNCHSVSVSSTTSSVTLIFSNTQPATDSCTS